MKPLKSLLLSSAVLLSLVGCSPSGETSSPDDASETESVQTSSTSKIDTSGATKLSFKAALSYDYLKSIDGEKVAINGYMATSSPVDGSFIFLMNLPYQSCPFCKPNTSMLSNTMEVYPEEGKKFTYTTSAISICGTLVVSATPEESFTDPYGYEFNFKIVDAAYSIIDEADMTPEMSTWQKVASSNLISDVYAMLDYTNFLALWPTYFVKSYEDIDGNVVPGYYLWPGDAERFLKKGAQYGYGREEGYFEGLRKKAKKIDETQLADLIAIIDKTEVLATTCYNALKNGEYTSEEKYVEKFGTVDTVFTLNEQASFEKQINDIYDEFALWFAKWEM